jgi:tetratricopeptide (TPR) repeat protein
MDLFDQLDPFIGNYLFILLAALFGVWVVRRSGRGFQDPLAGEGSVPAGSGLTGGVVAQRLLAAVGLDHVRLSHGGSLNCYHPWRKEIQLRQETYDNSSLASTAIAAHEVGHAQQFATGCFACRLRRIVQSACWILLVVCIALPMLCLNGSLSLVGLFAWLLPIAFVCMVAQLLVHMSMEKDATRRARALAQQAGLVNAEELPAFDRILNAAYRTHLAAHGQRLAVLLIAGAIVLCSPLGFAEGIDNDGAVAAAAPPPPAQAPQQQPPVEVIDLTAPLLSLAVAVVPLVLLLVLAAFVQGQMKPKQSASQRAVLRNNAGQVLSDRGQIEQAIHEFTAALSIDPQLIAAHYNRGNCRVRMGQFDAALADLDAALRLAPGFVDARALRGVVLIRKGDLDSALADLNHALALTPRHVGALTARGSLLLAQNHVDAALTDYTASLEQAPAQADALRDRGLCWLQKGILYRAAADLDESIRLNSADGVTFNNRGVVFLKAGDYRRAVADLDEAIRLMPALPNSHRHLAWLRATCPDPEFRNGPAAVASARVALELNGWKSSEWLGVLAAAHAEAGEWEQAIEWQTKCLDASPVEEQEAMRQRLSLYQSSQPFREEQVSRLLGVG